MVSIAHLKGEAFVSMTGVNPAVNCPGSLEMQVMVLTVVVIKNLVMRSMSRVFDGALAMPHALLHFPPDLTAQRRKGVVRINPDIDGNHLHEEADGPLEFSRGP